ncbi:16S rRNA (adenine(1518)-N(6)/adenine(1519)-N(6))-dimethyltransferase RsmA [Dawidia soli]|uniref:Ribosomal RNA small subunit methyltransferase A n=1 Tax=Dawidia soli TaxID=2782352 RepID=A0AAP2D7W5_9BACT|nr:16S rRNA (adenine(1518)-N(6)/adenine(1519)-N(6))-dimethyltransferase RsmA [Dawidia soli]MBT1685650.1 16S rRNA (adenine(1518)-N(6)/adenine(1519)-N(6))-dimethyltransferase RsmA [Dawidia soli]
MQRTPTNKVRPKKFLGQHFLHDQGIAKRIVDALQTTPGEAVLEIGPGMGVLTQYLQENAAIDLKVIEIDRDSVQYLGEHYPSLRGRIVSGDFLETDLRTIFPGSFSIIGNFPYNISSQIFFRVLAERQRVRQVVCMLQKEVADRIAEKPGSKTYGILSVLLQAYYTITYLFKVPPGVFTPPPKVMSAVIRLERNQTQALACDEKLFVQVVKQGFNNRRKTLRNALKPLALPAEISALEILDKRAEQLSVEEFVHLTQLIGQSRGAASTGI